MVGRRVLDLFCGAGGLALGFARAGFDVTGVDSLGPTRELFGSNRIGTGRIANLLHSSVNGGYDFVIGGPPCRPWSSVNLQRRTRANAAYPLLTRFFTHVVTNRPKAFLMENVPPALQDVQDRSSRLARYGYSMATRIERYSDYGAATSRRRLILFGSRTGDPKAFFEELAKSRRPAQNVRQAIGWLTSQPPGAVPDHDYPEFTTVEKYIPYYETGKFGWFVLAWSKPAPSFGNVMKTYTLHPSSWHHRPPRVISVREALSLMGFPREYRFPAGTGIAQRYQYVADSVSPVFAKAAALALDRLL